MTLFPRVRNVLFSTHTLYASTLFLSAFLVFLIQPIIGKYLLPWFGGSTAVWATSLLVFTTLLFLGYAYVYWLAKRTARDQARIHGALLTLGTLFVLLHALSRAALYPSLEWTLESTLSPSFQVIAALIGVIGIPYFLLATTGPLMQHWFSITEKKEPYALYAISNFGSFLALAMYPFLIEPFFPLLSQGWLFSLLFGAFVILCSLCTLHLLRNHSHTLVEVHHEKQASNWRMRSAWILLSALPAALLVATTTELTQAIVSFPFLWILPLSLYLISFTLAFRGWGGGGWTAVFAFAAGLVAFFYLDSGIYDLNYRLGGALAFLFLMSLYCNAQLFRLRPGKHDSPLFYLSIAFGGMLGTLLVSLLAPVLFVKIWEFALGIGISLALVTLLYPATRYIRDEYHAYLPTIRTVFLCVIILLGTSYYYENRESGYLKTRNFYGVVKITDWQGMRHMYHGGTLHGSQFLDEARINEPATYYGKTSGIGRSIAFMRSNSSAKKPLNVGVIGLGTGGIAAYCKPGDYFTFYEIDSRIEHLARTYFSNLSNCEGASVQIGDGRVRLEKESRDGLGKDFDILAVDAFSDDAIPTHLLTKEAFELYAKRVQDNGIIALHTSNRYLNLGPVAVRIGEEAGYAAKIIVDPGEGEGMSGSEWVLFSKDPAALAQTLFDVGTQSPPEIAPLWTDDYVNIFAALDLPPIFEWSTE